MKEKLPAKILAYFRKCGSKGGKTSAANMTAEARSKRAKKAVDARIAKARIKSTA